MADDSYFYVTLWCQEWDIQPIGHIPAGVVIEVRDYRLAENAEEGTTRTDRDGRPYFSHIFKDDE
jgi:hypothetical protein